MVYRITVKIDPTSELRSPFGKSDLSRECRGDNSTPIGSIAQKLYYHSHQKVADIIPDEERLLSSRFGMD